MTEELIEIEEEEYTSQLTAPVIRRILGLMRPHWRWVVGFFITIALTSSTDAYFTYINKQFVDQGINLKDPSVLTPINDFFCMGHGIEAPMWSLPVSDRAAYVGEASGLWLWAIAWPVGEWMVVHDDLRLHGDATSAVE